MRRGPVWHSRTLRNKPPSRDLPLINDDTPQFTQTLFLSMQPSHGSWDRDLQDVDSQTPLQNGIATPLFPSRLVLYVCDVAIVQARLLRNIKDRAVSHRGDDHVHARVKNMQEKEWSCRSYKVWTGHRLQIDEKHK